MIELLATTILTANASSAPLLLDARCDRAEYRDAARHDFGGGVTLLARHDADFVTLCLTLPSDSLGTMDLYIQGRDGALHNLHVSAQLGERTRSTAGWPAWNFGNQRRWYGPAVAFRGFAVGDDGQRRVDFAPSVGREIQIERARFGPGPWRVRFEVRALGADRNGAVIFPAGSTDSDPAGWAQFDFDRR